MPATVAQAATPVSPKAPRSFPVFYYTGDRAHDETKTTRQRTSGECLICLPGISINSCLCTLHPSNPLESFAPRCFPYSN